MSVLPEHLGDRAGVRTAARVHGLREIKRRRYKGTMSQIILEDFNLEAAERRLCLEALTRAGNIITSSAPPSSSASPVMR